MENSILKHRINAAELKTMLESMEQRECKLEDYDVLMVVCDYDEKGNRLEGYIPSSISTLELREKSYLRIKAFSENAAVYNTDNY